MRIILSLVFILFITTLVLADDPTIKTSQAGHHEVKTYEVPLLKTYPHQKLTPEDLQRQCGQFLKLDPEEAFWINLKDGTFMLVDPLISQRLR